MRHVSCATSVVCPWLTSSLAPRLIRSTVAIATTRNLHPDAMVVAKSSVLVSFLLPYSHLCLHIYIYINFANALDSVNYKAQVYLN